MKNFFSPMLIVLFFVLTTLSCNNEELFVGPTVDSSIDTTPKTDITPPEDTVDTVDTTLPCNFSFDTVQSGDTVVLDCILDLQGQTINLPPNVSIVYEGGDIINGTLNFADNSIISSELLNSTITLTGSKPQLKDTTFQFDPQRWGIIEGMTTSEIAQRNNSILENLMFAVKDMGVTNFKIDKMDAYFEVSKVTSTSTNANYYPSKEAINIPSGLNLIMTNETNLRVFPNDKEKYTLLAVDDAHDISISGGNLYGDRDQHDYSNGGTHEWGHVLELRSAVNVSIDGVHLSNGSGDGIDISSWGFSYQPEYKPSNNITISNCVLDSNRRNNMSITDGFNITIRDNEFLNASINTSYSSGIAPGFALDIEAERSRDSNGNLVYYQIAKDIKISNNIEKNSRGGAFIVFLGYDVLIEGNQTEKSIGYTYANGIKIRNNKITKNPANFDTTAITAGREGGNETIYNNEISGNIISGYDTGINVENRDTSIFSNTITEFITGIFPRNLENCKFYDNVLNSNRTNSRGIYAFQVNLNNVSFNNNTINVISNPIKFTRCNLIPEALNWNIEVKDNTTNSSSSILIESSLNIDFNNNNFLDNVVVYESNNIYFSYNTITTSMHGIEIRNINTNINLNSNIFNINNTNSECIKISSTTDPKEIEIINNTCNK